MAAAAAVAIRNASSAALPTLAVVDAFSQAAIANPSPATPDAARKVLVRRYIALMDGIDQLVAELLDRHQRLLQEGELLAQPPDVHVNGPGRA